MPEGRYNYLKQTGRVVENPEYVVWLEESEGNKFGFNTNEAVKSVSDYLLHRVKGVTLGKHSDYIEKNGHPNIIIDTGEEEKVFVWSESDEDYVEK